MLRSLLLLVSCCACARGLDVPNLNVRSVGAACDKAGQCTSANCVDGVCCATACNASESCHVADHLGACKPRANGAACIAASQCPSGFCADGVCCSTACTGTCQSCDVDAASAGTCKDAPDNSDSRAECGLCSACFTGECEPALVGSDPNGRCPAGQVCGVSQSCGLAGGEHCAANVDCAVGECLGNVCELVTVEHVFVDPMSSGATSRFVLGLASSRAGSTSVLFSETTQSADISVAPTEDDLFLATRSPSGDWIALDLFRDTYAKNGQITADLVYLGQTVFVAASSQQVDSAGTTACANPGAIPCGVFGQLVTPGGQLGKPEIIDADAQAVRQVALALDDQGRLVVAYDALLRTLPATPSKLYFRRRDVDATGAHWNPLATIAPADFSHVGWSFRLVAGRPVAFVASEMATLKAYAALPDLGPDLAPLASDCVPDNASLAPGAGAALLVTTFCNGRPGPFFLEYDVTQAPGARWSSPAPQLPSYVTGFEPMGLIGGVAAFAEGVNLQAGAGGGTFIEARVLLLHPDGTREEHVAFDPRGGNETGEILPMLGPSGLPVIAVVQGPVDTGGGAIPLELFLVHFHN